MPAAARQLLEADGRLLPADAAAACDAEAFARHGGQLAEPLQRRARHFFGEMERVTRV